MKTPLSFRLRWLHAVLAIAFGSAALPGQDVGSVVAGLREDIRILDERTRSLQVEVEQLKRENSQLRSGSSGGVVTSADMSAEVARLERAIRDGDKEVALQIAQQMEKLAKQTNAAIDAISRNGGGGGRVNVPPPNFTEDYPKKGVTYTVLPGDTLASIAQKLGSSVRDITNANKITDPRSLQAGQVLFVPQR